jgi:hypothetical protein
MVVRVQRLAQQGGHGCIGWPIDRSIGAARRLDPIQKQGEPSERIVAERFRSWIEHDPLALVASHRRCDNLRAR